MKVLELKGYKSLRAFNAFHTLMLGLKMLPMYIGESYERFYENMKELPESEQESMIRQAALFVELTKDEVEALASFCTDANGIPFQASNINNLSPDQIVDVIVSVCKEIAKFKIDLLTDKEKKN
jgi:hypothetical protein